MGDRIVAIACVALRASLPQTHAMSPRTASLTRSAASAGSVAIATGCVVASAVGSAELGIPCIITGALYNAAGLKARVRWFTYHEVPEAWFEGAWHYLDSEGFGYV